MPSLQLTVPAGALPPDALASVAARLPAPLLRLEGLPAEEPFLSGSWLLVHEVDAAFTGGRPAAAPVIRVDVTTTDGLLDQAGRRAAVEEITAALVDTGHVEAAQVLVAFHDVALLGLGGAGFDAQQVRELAGEAAAPRP